MFTPDTLAFLAENRFQNSKDWFTAHEKEYTAFVKEPMSALHEALAPAMLNIDGQFQVHPRNALSRIWCDLRFSHGNLYREMMWITYRRDRKAFAAWPEFYIVFSPTEFFYGCGYYAAKSEAMDEIRAMIRSDHDAYRAAKESLDAQNVFRVSGELYKRSRFPDESPEKRLWLDRKSIGFSCAPGVDALFDPHLAEKLAAQFTKIRPVYEFLTAAEERAARKE